MELSGTVLRHVTYSSFSRRVGGGGGACCHGHGAVPRGGGVRVSVGPRRVMGSSSSFYGFSDEGHVQYYSAPRCGGKDKGPALLTTTKNKLKLVKALSKGAELGFALDPQKSALLHDLQGNLTSDAAQLLMNQLEQLRAEEKEIKRKMKQEKKAKLKATKMKTVPDCESSSSSSESESSESECDEVVDMDSLRTGVTPAPPLDELRPPTMLSPVALLPQITTIVENPPEDATANHHAMELCSRNDTNVSSISGSFKNESNIVTTAPQKRIEVCMGNKCKRSGAAALLQELERVVDVEGGGAVVGCKCMGKCKSAPNVRIQNSVDDSVANGLNDSVQIPANPLCIGVGLEDVDAIVARYFGENQQDMGMAVAAT